VGEEENMAGPEAASALGGAGVVPIEADRRGDFRNVVCGHRG